MESEDAVDIFLGLLVLTILIQAIGFGLAAGITQITAPNVAIALGAASGFSMAVGGFIWKLKGFVITVIGLSN